MKFSTPIPITLLLSLSLLTLAATIKPDVNACTLHDQGGLCDPILLDQATNVCRRLIQPVGPKEGSFTFMRPGYKCKLFEDLDCKESEAPGEKASFFWYESNIGAYEMEWEDGWAVNAIMCMVK